MSKSHRDLSGEVAYADLLSAFEAFRPPVSDGRLSRLPLDVLSWEDFERLVARMVVHGPDSRFRQAHIYGRPGQTQHGIDIFAAEPLSKTVHVFQCKRVREVKRGELTSWVAKFLEGDLTHGVRRFVLCTSFDVSSNTHLIDEWKSCQFRLADREIDSDLWDIAQLNVKLRTCRSVVVELFGDDVASRFCVPETGSLQSPTSKSFPVRQCKQEGDEFVISNDALECRLSLPGGRTHSWSATLSFGRSFVTGAKLRIDGPTLLHWMQWRAHADKDAERPYAANELEGGQFLFETPAASLSLNGHEVENLDWVLRQAWLHFIEKASAHENNWKFLRFGRIQDQDASYAIAKIDHRLWALVLAFTQEHDCALGETDWHIFDAAPGLVRVYVNRNTQNLDRGYHLFLWPYNEPGAALPWDRDLILGWDMSLSTFDGVGNISPRERWDAEFAHDWLFHALIPRVLEWGKKRSLSVKQSARRLFFDKTPKLNSVDTSDLITSLACSRSREFSSSPTDRTGLIRLVEELQSHFNGSGSIPVGSQHIRRVLRVVDRMTPFSSSLDEFYMRAKLRIADGITVPEGVRALLQADAPPTQSRFMLDLALRSLLCVIETIEDVPRHEIGNAFTELRPVWDLFREDLLCSQIR
jgi:hypothetical protein